MCKGDINRHQPKTAKINLGLNHHELLAYASPYRMAVRACGYLPPVRR